MNVRQYPPLSLALAIWGMAAALYLIAFFHRVVPAVITVELTEAFGLSAAALGNLSALYFYAYVPLQIPFGAAADRFGARRVLTAGALVATAGAFQFAFAPSALTAGIGRFMIGAGVGVAFVCMLKLASHWFDPRRFAMLAGCSLLCGVLGAVSAGAPVRWLADALGWRSVVAGAGVLTALIALATWLLVRDHPTTLGYSSYAGSAQRDAPPYPLWSGIAMSFRQRNVRLILLVCSGVSGAPLTFAGLWGVPFLSMHYGFSTAAAAGLASLVLVAWALPSPILGAISDRMRRRKPIYAAGAILSLAAWSVVVLIPGLPRALLIAVARRCGMRCSVRYGRLRIRQGIRPRDPCRHDDGDRQHGQHAWGMLMQPAVGWVLDRFWNGETIGGARFYTFNAYRAAFCIMLAWLALSAILVIFTRETHCRQQR